MRGFGKNEDECTGKVELSTKKKILAVGEACVVIFWPTPGFKRRTSVISGFSTEVILISAFAVPHCVVMTKIPCLFCCTTGNGTHTQKLNMTVAYQLCVSSLTFNHNGFCRGDLMEKSIRFSFFPQHYVLQFCFCRSCVLTF